VVGAQALAAQKTLSPRSSPLAKRLSDNEQAIVAELLAVQGKPVDIGGYHQPDLVKLDRGDAPSPTPAALAAITGPDFVTH
jgi:isocitrate dehydrogenase